MENKENKRDSNKILIILAVALVLVLTYFIFFNKPTNQGNILSNSQNLVWEIVTTGTTGNGDVEIALTPLSLENNQLKVQISANTHSIELEQFDLKEKTELLYGDKTLKPATAPKLSGHHSSGILVFDIKDEIDKFIIIIGGIPKIEKRVFSW